MSIKTQRKVHLFLFWPAILAMVIYIVSALAHPLMVWTGPQAKKMFAPSMNISNQAIQAIPSIVENNALTSLSTGSDATISKLVPYQDQVLLQVSQDTKQARQYFSTTTFEKIPNHDQQQAIWLAHYFYGKELPIKSIELQTEFSGAYPAVNRLLPVYHIQFDTDDNLSMYIHTETMALAGISNDWKRTLGFVFRNFHSFDWLNEAGVLRIMLVSALTALVFTMAFTGLYLLIKIKRKKNALKNNEKQQPRRFHRLLAWITAVPLLMFSASGMYHLFMQAYAPNINDIQLPKNINFEHYQNVITLPDEVLNQTINHVSLFDGMYRISVSPNIKETNSRTARFAGRSKEQSAVYIDAQTGKTLNKQDKQLAIFNAAKMIDADPIQVSQIQLIHRFGPTYDFRNKRLPVWQIDFNTQGQDRLFIDPVNNILIDQNQLASRLEGYSFSFLHKWNMLIPLAGRQGRDVIISIVLSLGLVLTVLGYLIRKRKQKSVVTEEVETVELDRAA